MRFWKRDLNLAGTVGSGRKLFKVGEQRVNILREQVDVGYNLAGAGLKKQSHADL